MDLFLAKVARCLMQGIFKNGAFIEKIKDEEQLKGDFLNYRQLLVKYHKEILKKITYFDRKEKLRFN